MKKIAYLTGTRAEFGLMQTILTKIDKDQDWQLILLATGMHLLPEFGKTINEVKSIFPQVKIINATYEEDSRLSMAKFLGQSTTQLSESLNESKPDLVLVLGDRAEQLAMAQTAAYLAIPVIHLHGGETTTTIDDKARNAISMLADWHLPATKTAAGKLMKMGVKAQKIQIVGAPGLDQVNNLPKTPKDCLVILQHPDANEGDAPNQIRKTLAAALTFNLPVKVIYPNADAGGRAMITVINQYRSRVKIYPSLKRQDFLQLLSRARVLIGNSSAGLIEAPSLGLMAVNIGPRQSGRKRAGNIIDADYNKEKIIQAIKLALTKKIFSGPNPYGDGRTAPRVLKFLNQL
jgi:UDP-hydrolysing UDP-N-acetyl-D-glucosamine 2-epimerase